LQGSTTLNLDGALLCALYKGLVAAVVSVDNNASWLVIVSMSAMPEHTIYQWNYAIFSQPALV